MSTLEDPLSLRRRQCEERQRYVARLEAVAERLRADERRLRAEIQGAFADWLAPEAAGGKPVCARPLIERHGKLARTLGSVEGQIAAARNALTAAARELKQHELASSEASAICPPCARPAALSTAGLDCGN